MVSLDLTKEEISQIIILMDSSQVPIKEAEKVLTLYNKFKAAANEKE